MVSLHSHKKNHSNSQQNDFTNALLGNQNIVYRNFETFYTTSFHINRSYAKRFKAIEVLV